MVWRNVRPSWRFVVKCFALTLSLLAFFHFQPLQTRLIEETYLIAAGRSRCPTDFTHVEGNFLFITIKTTEKFHRLRIELIASTWMSEALLLKGRNDRPLVKVAVLSDAVDDSVNNLTGGRMVKSRCPSSHTSKHSFVNFTSHITDFCCKQAAEFDLYYGEPQASKWYCHFDDDNYVNIYQLLKELERHDASMPLYLGKSSRGMVKLKDVISGNEKGRVTFQFGTGGAGFCLTRVAMQRIMPTVSCLTGGSGLEGVCRKLPGLADDVGVGYVTGYYNITITEVPTMHSHLEKLQILSQNDIKNAISLSYTRYKHFENTVQLSSFHNITPSDPTKFRSLHAFLRPRECSRTITDN